MKKEEKNKLFADLPQCAAEFIKQVIKKMRYRKKVRADVMAELTAHFEDELKECATDEEKEQKAQQLITDFGDVKLLGVLLRRAKKRCRPLWRTIVARTFRTAGIIIVCFILYVGWFLSGKPVITTNYVAELNRIIRPVADESLNAAPLYERAAELYEKLPDDISKLLGKKYKEATAEEEQLIRKWIADNEEVLELVIAGTKKPYYWQKYADKQNTGEMMAILLPHLAEFRKLAYSLRWKIWLNVEQGRYEDAFSDIKSCYRFGQHLKGDKSFIEQLVGIAIEALSVLTVRDILSEHEIDSAALSNLQKDFEQMIADEDFTVNLKFAKLCMYDVIQRWFTEDRLGGGHISLEALKLIGSYTGSDLFEFILEGKHWTTPLHILFTHPNKQESREMVDRYYAFWGGVVHKSPAQIRAEGIDIEKEAMELINGNILLEILTPALGRVNEIAYRLKVDVESTLVIIAILRYRQDKADYPENLTQLLNAGYIKELPIDPFSNKPLVYKKTDGNFMLYSVGRNFKDDDGEVFRDDKGRIRKYADEGDWVFWPVQRNRLLINDK